MDYNFSRLVVRRMLSFPGIHRRRNRRHLHNLQERRTAQQTVLQVNQVVFADGSSVAGAGGNLDTEVTTNTESNDYQFLVTDRGITDALEDITAESVTVNQDTIPNVNQPADNSANVTPENDQLPNLTAWHNVTPIDSTLPDQDAGSFVYAKSATPLINNAAYSRTVLNNTGSIQPSESYLEIKEPGVYEIEADMYWVSAVSVGTEKTIATQIFISRHNHADSHYSAYTGIGPVSTCFMFGNVRMGSTSVSTVTQCGHEDRIRVMAVGTLASIGAPLVYSPPGRSSLRVRRISNHFNGHVSCSRTAASIQSSSAVSNMLVYRGLPEGIPLSDYSSSQAQWVTPINFDWSITSTTAHTWLSGARDYYIKIDPYPTVTESSVTRDAVLKIYLVRREGLNSALVSYELVEYAPSTNISIKRNTPPSYDDYVELLSGTFTNGLVRFKCGPGLNANDLYAGVVDFGVNVEAAANGAPTTASYPYLPTGWLHYSFS